LLKADKLCLLAEQLQYFSVIAIAGKVIVMFGQALIIDDCAGYVECMTRVRSPQYEYLFVNDTRTALYLLYEYDIDHCFQVIACNANIRGGDVFEFLRTLKKVPHLSSLPVVSYCVTSDLDLQALRVIAETLGADEFIASSSFDANTVCSEIERWLAHGHGLVPPWKWDGYDDMAGPPFS